MSAVPRILAITCCCANSCEVDFELQHYGKVVPIKVKCVRTKGALAVRNLFATSFDASPGLMVDIDGVALHLFSGNAVRHLAVKKIG